MSEWIPQNEPDCEIYQEGFNAGYNACLIEKVEKYRWHDLRRNPEDLPKHSNAVICAYDGGRDPVFYRLLHAKKNTGFNHVHYAKPIAWREIEPFEVTNDG